MSKRPRPICYQKPVAFGFKSDCDAYQCGFRGACMPIRIATSKGKSVREAKAEIAKTQSIQSEQKKLQKEYQIYLELKKKFEE